MRKGATGSPCRSAGFQTAVSRISNPQVSCRRNGDFCALTVPGWKPAIFTTFHVARVGNLRFANSPAQSGSIRLDPTASDCIRVGTDGTKP